MKISTTGGLAAITVAIYLSAPATAQIHVNLYNAAGATEATMSIARSEAERIMQSAGVYLTWSNCPRERPGTEACATPGPTIFQLRLYAAAAEPNFAGPSDSLGFALSQAAPSYGYFVGIFHARAEALARGEGIEEGQLLGHVIAHELGHLLLGGGGHSLGGIMKCCWRGKDLDRMRRGILLFLPPERKTILGTLKARQMEVRIRRDSGI